MDLIIQEYQRYSRKGFVGLSLVFLLNLLIYWVIPTVMRDQWEYLFPEKPDRNKYLLIQSLSHFFIFAFWNSLYLGLYLGYCQPLQKYKISADPWPWQGNEKEKEKFKRILRNAIYCLFVNILVLVPALSLLEFKIFGIRQDFSAQKFPSNFDIFCQMMFFVLCEDFGFYWSHRMLHSQFFYKYVHKQHHQMINPISIGAEFAHPFQFVFGNVVPFLIGPAILGPRVHFFTKFYWIFIRLGVTTDAHSGYQLPFSPYRFIPFSTSAEYHNYHHSHNLGNYGSGLSIWDTVCGTNKSYFKWLGRKSESVKNK